MNISETDYHKAKNFRGFIELFPDVFDQITPFLMRDQEKMHALLRDAETEPNPPSEDTEIKEWSGYILVRKDG